MTADEAHDAALAIFGPRAVVRTVSGGSFSRHEPDADRYIIGVQDEQGFLPLGVGRTWEQALRDLDEHEALCRVGCFEKARVER